MIKQLNTIKRILLSVLIFIKKKLFLYKMTSLITEPECSCLLKKKS